MSILAPRSEFPRTGRSRVASTGQIFIELAFVGGTYTLGKILGAIFYAVENADVLQAATVVKEVVPGERGVDFYRGGCRANRTH